MTRGTVTVLRVRPLLIAAAAMLATAAGTARAQVVPVAPSPQIGSSNPITAEPPVARPHVRPCVVRGQGQGAGQGRFRYSQARGPIVDQMIGGHSQIDTRHADQSLDIFGIERQGAFKKTTRFRHEFGCYPLVRNGPALEIHIRRIGMRRAFGSLCLNLNKLAGQRVGKPRDDFILHIEQICDGLVEALSPKMVAGFCVD